MSFVATEVQQRGVEKGEKRSEPGDVLYGLIVGGEGLWVGLVIGCSAILSFDPFRPTITC